MQISLPRLEYVDGRTTVWVGGIQSALAKGFGGRGRVMQAIDVLGLQIHALNVVLFFKIFIKLVVDLLVSPVDMFGIVRLKVSVRSYAIPGKFSSLDTGRGVIKLLPRKGC